VRIGWLGTWLSDPRIHGLISAGRRMRSDMRICVFLRSGAGRPLGR